MSVRLVVNKIHLLTYLPMTGTRRAGAGERAASRSRRAAERTAVGAEGSHRTHSSAHHHVHPRPDGHASHAA